MIRWEIKNNVISKLFYKGKNIINPWGFETADSSAFFSLEEGVGYRYSLDKDEYFSNDFVSKANIVTNMQEGRWELSVNDRIDSENTVIRKVEAITLEDTIFMDFVMRFRFKKDIVEYAKIADKILYHQNTNIYNQYPVDSVLLKCKKFNIKITILDKQVPIGLEPVIYVRDRNDEWVVHVRMIPRQWDKEVIKICTKWAQTRPIPQILSKYLLSFRIIRDALWYRGEKKPFKSKLVTRFLNPAAFGMVLVPKDTRLMWNVKMEII